MRETESKRAGEREQERDSGRQIVGARESWRERDRQCGRKEEGER